MQTLPCRQYLEIDWLAITAAGPTTLMDGKEAAWYDVRLADEFTFKYFLSDKNRPDGITFMSSSASGRFLDMPFHHGGKDPDPWLEITLYKAMFAHFTRFIKRIVYKGEVGELPGVYPWAGKALLMPVDFINVYGFDRNERDPRWLQATVQLGHHICLWRVPVMFMDMPYVPSKIIHSPWMREVISSLLCGHKSENLFGAYHTGPSTNLDFTARVPGCLLDGPPPPVLWKG